MFVPGVDSGFRGADGLGHWELRIGRDGRDDGEPGSQRAVIELGLEDGGAQSLGGDAVTVSFRDTLAAAVQAQAAQVVGFASRGVLEKLVPEQWSEVLADILVGEC